MEVGRAQGVSSTLRMTVAVWREFSCDVLRVTFCRFFCDPLREPCTLQGPGAPPKEAQYCTQNTVEDTKHDPESPHAHYRIRYFHIPYSKRSIYALPPPCRPSHAVVAVRRPQPTTHCLKLFFCSSTGLSASG